MIYEGKEKNNQQSKNNLKELLCITRHYTFMCKPENDFKYLFFRIVV